MLIAVVLVLILAMLLVLIRATLGPSLYDRILAVNVFGSNAVLLIAAYTFISGRHELLDIALIYALINFVGNIALLRFFSFGSGSHKEVDL
ncbi:monovalent cation/H+ antiporter complex subunit F [Dasania marina]|uniref:monovalent cation/H+ antiporter complex subunit F n=1 Tax=Dasania marina TaxID=471499 RepID=UPI00037D1B58|nr:monovalent cation/H+ antiporter complex subunit F [Dasania marina]